MYFLGVHRRAIQMTDAFLRVTGRYISMSLVPMFHRSFQVRHRFLEV
jgi:hypothetical protein